MQWLRRVRYIDMNITLQVAGGDLDDILPWPEAVSEDTCGAVTVDRRVGRQFVNICKNSVTTDAQVLCYGTAVFVEADPDAQRWLPGASDALQKTR